ncbi:MAG: asparagine synthase-related protein [Candidatus Nitrosocaldus sp.]|nr:asparagine synthase-related protein [Candidatus Nitrosocaldus sp.]MDW8276074.1 asparagine synthase-related protein [Candidatus Nitrosocaldus sp.]
MIHLVPPAAGETDAICSRLREVLMGSVQECLRASPRPSLLLSGGLDSSILAALASGIHADTGAAGMIAVCIGHDDAQDMRYARIVAERFNIRLLMKCISVDEMLYAAREIIRIMHSFDPMEVRNSIVVYTAMRELEEHGIKHVMTGDGGDEIFAGYSYMLRMNSEQLRHELARLERIMHFSSIRIAEDLHMNLSLPYLNRAVIEYARSIPVELKVNEYEGKRYGKFVLRSCFEHILGKDVAWRAKMPMEQGAYTSILSSHLDSMMSDEYLARRRREYIDRDRVRIRSKEHLYYYEIYRGMFGAPYSMDCRSDGARCSECGACISPDARFCRVCGAFPTKPVPAG